MTKDDVLRMAKEAAQFDGTTSLEKSVVLYAAMSKEFLEKFAELVRADEREACAKVCEEWLHGDWHNQGVVAAAMIRARGEK
jgi:hypothetical protein